MIARRDHLVFLDQLHDVASQHEQVLHRMVLEFFHYVDGSLPKGRLRDLVASNSTRSAAGLVANKAEENLLVPLKRELHATLEDAAKVGEAGLPSMHLDIFSQSGIAAIDRIAAALVQTLDQRNFEGVQAVLLDAYERHLSPIKATDMFRMVLGLDARLALAVGRHNDTLLGSGMKRKDAQRGAWRYAERLRFERAQTIAKTESMRAANLALQLLWEQAVRDGKLSGFAKKQWLVPPDDVKCEKCVSFNGVMVPIHAEFASNLPHPPAHPRCACGMALTE